MNGTAPQLPFPLVHTFRHDGKCYAFSGSSLVVAQVSEELGLVLEVGAKMQSDAFHRELDQRLGAIGRSKALAELSELAKTEFFRPRAADEQLREIDAGRIEANIVGPIEPVLLQLAVSSECNLRCRYCYADFGAFQASSSSRFMSLQTVDDALGLLLASDQRVLRVTLLGGEPLLHPQFAELLDLAQAEAGKADKTVIFSLDTNGTHLTAPQLAALVRHGVSVSVSLDGPDEIQNANRPFIDGRASYATVVANTQRLAEALPPGRLAVTITCCPDDIDRVLAFRGTIHDLFGPIRVNVAPVYVPESHPLAWRSANASRWDRCSRRFLEIEIADKKRQDVGPIDAELQRHQLTHRRVAFSPCAFSKTQLAVSVDGDVYPCIALVGYKAFHMGNVSARDAITRPPAVIDCIRRSTCLAHEECGGCWAKYLCGGGCAVVNLRTSGDCGRSSEAVCTLMRSRHEGRLRGYITSRTGGLSPNQDDTPGMGSRPHRRGLSEKQALVRRVVGRARSDKESGKIGKETTSGRRKAR